jgi:DNA-directed RNA polymerase specialized sigma24 family protein
MAALTTDQLTQLYLKGFPVVARYVARRGGTMDEAKDVFQDALIILYEKHADGLTLNATQQAYLMGIAKHLWLRRFEANNRYEPLTDQDIYEDDTLTELSGKRILNFLQTAGKRCLELLSSFYYEKQNMTEIAGQFGYSSTHSATVQKYKCLEKVRDTVKQKQLTYEDFLE